MGDKCFGVYLRLVRAGAFVGCHQKPERSFFIGNWQFPVCARCTGVFAGELLMAVLLLFGVRTPLLTDFLFLFVMFSDWFVQHVKMRHSTNVRRLITGVLAGLAMTSLYFKIICAAVSFLVV